MCYFFSLENFKNKSSKTHATARLRGSATAHVYTVASPVTGPTPEALQCVAIQPGVQQGVNPTEFAMLVWTRVHFLPLLGLHRSVLPFGLNFIFVVYRFARSRDRLPYSHHRSAVGGADASIAADHTACLFLLLVVSDYYFFWTGPRRYNRHLKTDKSTHPHRGP